jgi:hypothetical protein
MAKKGMHPLEALMFLAPACAFWMLLFAAFTELPRALHAGSFSVASAHPWHFAASAVAGFAVNSTAFAVVGFSSALTLKVLAICKDVGLVAFGALALHEKVGSGQAAGYAVSIAGVAWYNWLKARGGGAAAAAAAAAEKLLPVKIPELLLSPAVGGGGGSTLGRGRGGGGGGGGAALRALLVRVSAGAQRLLAAGGLARRGRRSDEEAEGLLAERLPTIVERISIEGTDGRVSAA